jgi:hypothetical protein
MIRMLNMAHPSPVVGLKVKSVMTPAVDPRVPRAYLARALVQFVMVYESS